MNSKLGSGVFPQRLLLTLSVTARIGQTLLNEVQAESYILANLANYYFKSLNGNIDGSRKNNMHGSLQIQNRKSGRKSIKVLNILSVFGYTIQDMSLC